MKDMRQRVMVWLLRVRKDMRLITPFVLVCGAFALLYFFYRVILLAVPVVSIEQSLIHPHGNASIVCGQEGGQVLKDPAPVISASYQKRIKAAPALSVNMVTNANLASFDADGQPVGYSQTIENQSSNYTVSKDPDATAYLRSVSTINTASMPAWQIDPVPVGINHSYAYSFWYRSSSPVDVTRITSNPGGLHYGYVVTLPSASQWTQFTAEYTNSDETKNMQLIISGTEKGTVDTRGYDIHQIPDAALSRGIISVTFDDGWESTYTKALPLLEKYSITTTQYIIAEVAANNIAEYMNFDEIKQLRARGDEIGSHSLRHCDQVVLDQKSLVDNAERSQQLLAKEAGPIKSFAYPLGQYNQLTQTAYETYYPLIRTSDTGYNDRYFDETNIHSMAILDTTTEKQFTAWIEYAKTHNVWLVLAYHRVDASGTYNISSATLDKQLSLIRASRLTVLPVATAAAAIR